MDLRGGNITLGELVASPKARALVDRELPGLLQNPMARHFYGLTLNRAVAMARGRISPQALARLLEQLKAL